MKTENWTQYDTDETNGMGLKLDAQIYINGRLKKERDELLNICKDLMAGFVHKEGDKKGNQARTDIFKYCPEFREIAVRARKATE